MPQFYFNLHEADRVLTDHEGVDLADTDAAHANAFREARELMAAEVSSGQLCLSCHIEVQDDERSVLFVVAFKDALVLSGHLPEAAS